MLWKIKEILFNLTFGIRNLALLFFNQGQSKYENKVSLNERKYIDP